MPGSAKNKPSTQSEKPVTISDSLDQQNAGIADKDKDAGSSAEIEIGGRKGLEPTRFGDWEKNGRCTDF
jgi:hypothetical protein